MAYKTFDINDNEINNHDLQDKGFWCKDGLSQEESFIEIYGKQLDLIINPQKKADPYAPDLLNTKNGLLADLKTQNTPFFQAQSRFGLSPQHTVVFNQKDRMRYREKYPTIEIYFAVDWHVIKFVGSNTIAVNPMKGIWFIPFQSLDTLLNDVPFHAYQQRKYDTLGNAKGSFILDLNNSEFKKVL